MHNKKENRITSLSIAPGRYADALLTKEEKSEMNINYNVPDELKIPYYFGYNENISLSKYFNENVYMTLSYRDRILYKEALPEMEHLRYMEKDFDNLEKDKKIIKIYENAGLNNYFVYTVEDYHLN